MVERGFSPAVMAKFHKQTDRIRNICILAHVDHGKTTLADSLLASNGIISNRLAGKMRYLDSRDDEQARGITMKSSAVTLLHRRDGAPHLINVIDSPGHIDFSSEVSSAVRLSDGAIVIVDVVEGVSAQTHAVLRQAWMEHLKPCLVLNKIDRLITEMQMTPEEAYAHMRRILEQVNAITSSLFTSRMLSEIQHRDEREEDEGENDAMFEDIDQLQDDTGQYFEPESGNVAFASALDGWAFTVETFAAILAAKFKCRQAPLQRCLWGDYYLTREKGQVKIKPNAALKAKTPLFVKFILQPLWEVHDVILANNDKERMAKLKTSLNVKVSARDAQAEPKVHLQALLTAWLPLAKAILDMTCSFLPSPLQTPGERFTTLLRAGLDIGQDLPQDRQELCQHMAQCDQSEDAATNPIVGFVSKMVAVPTDALPENQKQQTSMEELAKRRAAIIAKRKNQASGNDADGYALDVTPSDNGDNADNVDDDGDEEETPQADVPETQDPITFIAYARVFSGVLRPGMKIYVLGPKYDPSNPDEHCSEATITQLYLFMGRSMLPLDEAVAGTVVGIAGLHGHVLKSATLSTTKACPPLAGMYQHVKPIVRVALETERIQDMPLLKKGMMLLNQADPCVEVLVQETGEHVLVAAGEVHIERCITDLKEQFAPGIQIRASKPIIPFRETVVIPPTVDQANEEIADQPQTGVVHNFLLRDNVDVDDNKVVTITTASKRWTLRLLARPMPEPLIDFFEANSARFKALANRASDRSVTTTHDEQAAELQQELRDIAQAQGDEWTRLIEGYVSCGPRSSGANILSCCLVEVVKAVSVFHKLNSEDDGDSEPASELAQYANSLQVGFQLITQAGPLCEEPLLGVCYEIVDIGVDEACPAPDAGFAGQVISAMQTACRQAMLVQPCRLRLAMFKCDLVVSAAALGKVYTVIGRRSGRVISEEMKEGSDNFAVTAVIPVPNSFGFADEMRKRTSGLAVPQLIFSHWEVLEEDPFWVPVTEEELTHFGDKGDAPNVARQYMDDVRKQKGLAIEEKIVEHAEKQRTISRKK
eukprot:TRINITY_DN11666_c0_g1_i8.p1 TRINITY_DN11666_c0_g1~~TRINITY_DN11666_c0_g1_i8.p1  ORF type:complete len:1050 (+),score=270.78 TRINITY_DN11666_c0_g1_i8:3-3152(+)